MYRFSVRFLSCLLAFAFLGLCCYAQFSGNIQGVVLDPSGAAIAKASVQLRNVDTGITQTAVSGDSGNYSFSNLQPGDYVLIGTATGFKTTQVHLTLSTAQLQAINITMPLASVAATVTVTSEAPAMDTGDSRLQTTLSSQTVRDLPQLNRNLWDDLAVQPGVVGTGTRGAGESPGGGADNFGTQTPQISANGRSYTGNVVFVDGMNVTSPVQNGNIILAPIPDAIQEASLQTNSFDAENSLGSSVLIQITTKSGTNQFHGDGDLVYTNQDLQAIQTFQNTVAPFGRKDLVGALGGPIKKDKAFFFADVEKLWAKTPEQQGTATWDSPEFDSWANANFPATTASNIGTQILDNYPASYLHSTGVANVNIGTAQSPNLVPATADNYLLGGPCPAGQTTIAYNNAPNGATATVPCNLPVLDTGSFVFSPYYNALQYNFRFDYYLTTRDRFYLSYYNDSFDQQSPSPRANLGSVNIMRNRYGQVDYTHTFNSNLLLESSFGFASVGGANGQFVPGQNLSVPEIGIADNSQGVVFSGGFGPGEYRGPNYNWRAVLNWVHGAHTFKFGYDADHAIEHGDFTPTNVRPNFTFNNLFDLVLNSPFNESVGAYGLNGQPGYVVFGGQENPFGFYAQDDWKAKPNLTLTLALRWDDFTNHSPWADTGCAAPINSCFRFSDIFLGTGTTRLQQITGATVKQRPDGLFTSAQTNYWSPRIGVAWDPTGQGSWVVRGGIGVYRDWVVLGQSVDQMRNNPPSVLSETFTAGSAGVQPQFALAPNATYPFNFPLPTIGAVTIDPVSGGYVGIPSNVNSLAPNLTPPLSVNYVVGLEHQLPWKFVSSVSYSGSRSYNGLTGTDWNRCPNCTVSNRPNPNFLTMTYVTSSNSSTYNSMILAVRRNAGARGSFQASYTLSHAKDYPEAGTRFDQDGGLNIPDPAAYFSYYSDANWDVRQRFSFSGLYNIPGIGNGLEKGLTSGWEISSIAAIQSGTPYWVTCNAAACDYNNDGVNYDVPNAPAANFTGSHSRGAYENGIFTAGDFSAPAPGTEGNLARNSYRNPGLFQVDAAVLKNTHVPWLGEAGNFQIRFDFLNVFNVTNLGSVDANMNDFNFGKVTTALPKREIEIGARIAF